MSPRGRPICIVTALGARLCKARATFPRGAKPGPQRVKNADASLHAKGVFADDDMVVFKDIGERFLEPDGTLSKDVMPDLLHPQEKGYRIWAEAIEDEISALIGPR